MATWTSMWIALFVAGLLVYDACGTPCSTESDCLHFQYCCKGNCTSKRLQCHHICTHDTNCESHRRCFLGLCLNCTDELTCDRKKCLNDSHCPDTHTCDDNACSVKKPNDLTSEMVPFIIFISALSMSLLIVCYNDYILERLGHRNCRECFERTVCNCSLILKIWIWRQRRLQARNAEHSSCPAVEVQFDSRIFNPSNTFNEKRETGFSCSLRAFKDRLMFWRHYSGNTETNYPTQETEESHQSATPNTQMASSSVVLLNEFMNTNELRRTTSDNLDPNPDTGTSNTSKKNEPNEDENQNEPLLPLLNTTVSILSPSLSTSPTRSSGDEGGIEVNKPTTLYLGGSTPSIATASHSVTTV